MKVTGKLVCIGFLLLGLPVGAAQSSQQESRPAAPPETKLQDFSQEQPPPPPPPLASPEERAALRQIEEASKQNPAEVPQLVDQFLGTYPESVLRNRVYAAGAAAYRTLGNLEKSIEYAERGLQVAPNDPILLIQLADGLAETAMPGQLDFREKLERAEAEARRAQELLSALFAQTTRRPEVPLEEYDRQQDYVESLPYSILGSIALKRQQFRQAAEEFKHATELNQSSADDFLRLGVSQMMLQEWSAAKASLERCIALSPQGSPVAQYAKRRLEMVEHNLQATSPSTEPKPQQE